jgi:ferredoxin
MKARIDRELCAGTGWCLVAAPQVFKVGDDGQTYAADSELRNESLLWRAAEGCPRQAVILEDDDGNQIYPSEGTGCKLPRRAHAEEHSVAAR